jgi:hypothetical protein
VQADRHAGVARHPGDQVDVVLAGEQIDVGACMPMRHRDRATANGRIHARDLGQLAERTAHDQPLFIGHTRSGDVVDDDLGGLTEKFELRLSLRSCRRGTSTSGAGSRSACRWLTSRRGAGAPAAQQLEVPGPPTAKFFATWSGG